MAPFFAMKTRRVCNKASWINRNRVILSSLPFRRLLPLKIALLGNSNKKDRISIKPKLAQTIQAEPTLGVSRTEQSKEHSKYHG